MADYGNSSSRLLRWLVVGPVAVAGLAAVVAGGPLLLLWLGGNPLPGKRLTTGELIEILTSPDDGQLLLWALTVVGWVAWAVIAGSLLLELGAQLTGKRTPQVPGLAGPQRLAGALVAGVLAALTAPGIGHAHAAYLDEQATVVTLDDWAYDLDDRAPHKVGEVRVTPSGAPGALIAPLDAPGALVAPADSVHPTTPAAPTVVPLAAQDPEPASQQAQEQLVHEVAPGDWMWHIAGRYLGDELRYPEIAALNPQYAELYQDYPDHIQPGDRLILPADAYDRGERSHATGETIGQAAPPPAAGPEQAEPEPPAESELEPAPPAAELEPPAEPAPPSDAGPGGDEQQSPPPEVDERALGSPDEEVGRDGQAAESPAEAASPPAPPVPAEPPTAAEPPAAVEPPTAAEPAQEAEPPAAVEPPQEREAAPQLPPAASDRLPDPAADGSADAAGQSGDDSIAADEQAATLSPLLTTGVLASALLGALVLYRWRKMARRRHRRLIASGAGADTESDLRAGATADVARLDQALRLLAVGPRTQGAEPPAGQHRLPDVGAVWIGEGEIHLILATPAEVGPPEPFHSNGPGGWFLPAQSALPAPASGLAPLPTLVTIGTQPGQHLLIDLERMGMLTVFSPPERGRDLLRYLVAELVHNPWSERVEVTLAGLPTATAQGLAALHPTRITIAENLPEAVNQLRRRLVHTSGALEAHGLTDSVHGRVTDTTADTWNPQLLIIDQPGAEHDELLTYLERALADVGKRAAVAVVVTAPTGVPYGRRTITLTEDGLLRAGFLDESHPMPAAALPEHLLAPLADLLRDAATGPDHPIPPATESWAEQTDATGGRVAAAPEANNGSPPAEALVGAGQPIANAGQPSANGGQPSAARQPSTNGSQPDHRDQELDEAFAEWQRDGDQPPRIAILGPVRVVAAGPPPTHRARLCQELVVYLAARGEQGADAAELTSHLWPGQPPDPAVRTAVLTSARRWLGNAPDGEPWLTEAGHDGRYRLRAGPLIDWHLFRRLRTRGEQVGPAGARDLKAALWLVRGAPLADIGELASASTRIPYSWLPHSSVNPELILAGVVDTAHQLVELSLAAGDLATAHWAVQRAWLADPRRSDDHPWRDVLRLRHAEGDQEQLRAVVADLLRWRDAEHPDELSPATRDLIRELVPYETVGAGEAR